jgi:hypothetical protein
MRFLAIYSHIERATPTTQEEMEAMGKLIDQMKRDGTLITTEGCLPSTLGARVRRSGDKLTVTDGPFAETKELVGGFAIIEATSKEHAIELTKTFLQVAGDGVSEIRQLYEEPAG